MDEQPKKSNSNKKTVLIVVIVALIIGGAAAAYFLTKDDNKSNSSANTANSSTQQNSTTNNSFAPASTSGKPFVATINTNAGGNQVTGVMSSDGQGNVSYAYKADGKDIKLIYTADAYYLCSGTDTCIKYPSSKTSSSGFDPSAYQYNSDRINNLKNTAAYKGQQTCPGSGGGTCDVWQVSVGSATSTMYLNSSTKQIAKVTTTSGTTTSDITYEYKNVTVAAPASSITLPGTGQ